MHEERIDFVIKKALGTRDFALDIDVIAVTVGPGLSIALGVGINKAKELAKKYNKPLIPVNHVESHLLSSLATPKTENLKLKINNLKLPSYGLVVSGGNTLFVKINKIGNYEILAQTVDDALGEALDKGARMLGLGYPGGAILEKMARLGNSKKYTLPIPLVGQEKRMIFSYSGLKTSMMRKIAEIKSKKGDLSKQDIYDLSAAFQDVAFRHIERVLVYTIENYKLKIVNLLVGGGVSANVELRKRLRKLGRKYKIRVSFPYSKKLTGDNAAMIGVAAYLKIKNEELAINNYRDFEKIDRNPNLKLSDI
jgi:N6-L-threonylcarbamoyladenine synthase